MGVEVSYFVTRYVSVIKNSAIVTTIVQHFEMAFFCIYQDFFEDLVFAIPDNKQILIYILYPGFKR